MRNLALALLFVLMAGATAYADEVFLASLTGNQEVPAVATTASGRCTALLNVAETQVTVTCTFTGLTSNAILAHTHGNGVVGVIAPVIFNYTPVPSATSGTLGPQTFAISPAQVTAMRAHQHYANIHSSNFPSGEIRGQFKQAHTVYDRDGDGRTDITVFRQSANTLFNIGSLTGAVDGVSFGSGAGDIWLNNTADFDGDGRGDPLLLELDGAGIATWSILQTGNNTLRTLLWGNFNAAVGDTLAIGDYDGDGKQDPALFRRSNGQWSIMQSSTGTARYELWGAVNDQPSVGDYDGDGLCDLMAVRVESGQRVFYLKRSVDGTTSATIFGSSATDGFFFFAPFDIDGDGRQDIAVNRAISGQRVFFILRSSDGAVQVTPWGASGTTSTAFFGDYDGDGKTDLVARQLISGAQNWFIRRSSDGGQTNVVFGITGDQ